MRSDAAGLPVAIVGGGFSGTMTAVQLARRGVRSVLLDGGGRMHRGVAYSTAEPAHLLNVPSGKMSAWPDRAGHFAQWLGDDGTSFAERRGFGRYVEGIALAHDALIERREQGASAASPADGGWQIELADGSVVQASALVLASGNQPPAPMRVAEDAGALFVNNPWSQEAAAVVARIAEDGGDVLILGTGLTMIDTVLSLAAAGHKGRVLALSRRGLLPRSHAPHQPFAAAMEEVPAGKVLPLWRWLRRRSADVGFRAAVDSLRPHSQALWQAFPPAEQRRFLRHARPWWDVHRHRIAPQIGEQLATRVADWGLEIVAGRLRLLQADGDGLAATIMPRGSIEPLHRRFAATFNCTGPLGDIKRTRDPLLRQMLSGGLVRPDELGMGLAVDERSRAGSNAWAVGPLTKGCFWEIVAVPDIRGQAEAVAADIVRELTR
ncbi:FAD/NAD(P)-binding protein [uncultured Sphingomonas sp.]|uniref:FAD/NAD(P)-binding protein n=1 Tax=uncultured Sphingomonas sp. TaxID=158754 RepID=UPI0025DD8F8E|nr:FAD/NAD(P)-binding protein [uncultured Sphingomonas sp.]